MAWYTGEACTRDRRVAASGMFSSISRRNSAGRPSNEAWRGTFLSVNTMLGRVWIGKGNTIVPLGSQSGGQTKCADEKDAEEGNLEGVLFVKLHVLTFEHESECRHSVPQNKCRHVRDVLPRERRTKEIDVKDIEKYFISTLRRRTTTMAIV